MWKQLTPEESAGWDRLLDRAGDDNPFQSEAWARYKEKAGWEAQRWTASAGDGTAACALQLLKKNLPLGRSLIWVPGGPMTGFPGTGGGDPGSFFREGLREICRSNQAVYARFYSLQPSVPETREILSGLCAAVQHRVGSGTTVKIDLTLPEEELLKRMEKKHRYEVRRLKDGTLRWDWGNSAALLKDLGRLHAEMAAAKKVAAADTRDLSRLMEEFGQNARILAGYDGSEPVTACLILLKGKSAFYWRAATARKGRELSASYAMVWEVLKRLKGAGIERFDFGGILPGVRPAEGINHFKQGFGGEIVEYLGEWEWASAPWVRWGVNAWVAVRGQS